MKVKLKLVEIDIKKLETREPMTFIFKPTLPDYKELVTLRVRDDKKLDPLNKLGLPISVGDTILMDFGKKESQSSLKSGEDKGKK